MNELLDARLSLEVPIAGRAAVNADDDVADRLEQAIHDAEGHKPGTEPFNTADTRSTPSSPRRPATSCCTR